MVVFPPTALASAPIYDCALSGNAGTNNNLPRVDATRSLQGVRHVPKSELAVLRRQYREFRAAERAAEHARAGDEQPRRFLPRTHDRPRGLRDLGVRGPAPLIGYRPKVTSCECAGQTAGEGITV